MGQHDGSYNLLEGINSENRLYFNDGKRRIDYMLAYLDDHETNSGNKRYFDLFLKNLESTYYLQIEKADPLIQKSAEEDCCVKYVKIHAPIEVLYDIAEDLSIKMPTKLNDINIHEWYEDTKFWNFLTRIDPFKIKSPETQDATNYFVATFQKERLTEFVNHEDPERFFTPSERGRLVDYILKQTKFSNESTDVGIGNLIHKGVFLDAFPLHDGPVLKNKMEKAVNARQRLQKDWASFRCMLKYQPIDAIREYFGEKLAIYFSWLGFYTMFLIPPASVGFLCFLYGVITTVYSPVVQEMCNENNQTRFYMCPLCDKECSYFLLENLCIYTKVTHFFDNEATLFFAVFMSIWATLFLEFWKRQQVSLAHKWHTLGFEEAEEPDRPEYILANPTLQLNPVNQKYEPHMTSKKKAQKIAGTCSIVLFFIVLVIGGVFGVVVFRVVFSVVLQAASPYIRENSQIVVSIISGLINLLAIIVLGVVYEKVAVLLTDWENPRTRTEYEDSFTLKMFWFQFFNTYSWIFYIAFFKFPTIVGTPGRYRHFNGIRLEGCSAQGCFLELTIQIAIVMVGQQFVSNVFETLVPSAVKWWKKRKEKKSQGDRYCEQPQWVDDYSCEIQTKFSLFWEYLEIVIQYGFITMFVTAFPLAPFFALFSNIIEIRVDAFNFVANRRRPVAQMAEDIGAWYSILATITSVSVLINAFVLAFTSEFIPGLVYRYQYRDDGSMNGFVGWSLSTFNVTQFPETSKPRDPTANGIPEMPFCRYPGFQDQEYPYSMNLTYWMITSARLAFVLCFVVFVFFVKFVVMYVVPDIPNTLELKIKREKFLATQADKEHKEKTGKRTTVRRHVVNEVSGLPGAESEML